MSYLDEEIAKLEKQRRQEAREKQEGKSFHQNLREESEVEGGPSLQEMMEGLAKGVLAIEGTELAFEKTSIMETGIRMFLPRDFVMTLETSEHLVYSHEKLELNLIMQWIKPVQAMSIAQFKEIMQQQFRTMELGMSWIEDGVVVPCSLQTRYCVFSSSVANGQVFNYQAFIDKEDYQLIFNVNGNLKRWDHWKPVITGMISSLEVTGS